VGSTAARLIGLALAAGACVDLGHLAGGDASAPDVGATADAAQDASAPQPADAATTEAATDAADASSTSDAGVDPGLVGYWKLDEGSGTVVADSSGKGNAGVVVGGAAWDAGDGGPPSLFFDGVGGHVEIGGAVAYATQRAPFSFSAWFNLVDFLTHEPDIMQLRSDSPYPWHVILSDQAPYLGVSVGSADTWAPLKTGSVPSTGAWHHVAVTYDGVDPTAITSFRIFLDGAPQPLTQAAGYGSQAQQSRIGAAESAGNYFHGAIRQIRIYDRTLSVAEIAALYASR
jgi:hypothetical protein